MNEKEKNLLQILEEAYPALSKRRKALADFIRTQYDKTAFMTAAALAKETGVSEATVVRFARALGYQGYPHLQKAMEQLVVERIRTGKTSKPIYGEIDPSNPLRSVLQSDIRNIQCTMEMLSQESFGAAVETILKGRTVYVLGIRNCSFLSSLLGFYLKLVVEDVRVLQTNSLSEIFEQMLSIDQKDVMIGISFPRYSMRTLKALEFANDRQAKIITLTDSTHSPLNLYSSCNLVAKSRMASVIDSLTAPLSVINALVVALCVKKEKKVMELLACLEQVWESYQSYDKDEMDYLHETLLPGSSQEKGETGKELS